MMFGITKTNQINMNNYIQDSKITRLDGNDSFSHKEIFSINRNGKIDNFTYYTAKTY